ncbi:MAG TPA: P1 family peptidase [Gemmatimonadaceae bacterium]|nr:P1 family peptidase [Gemmatimonadaceae bacterium]
MRSRRALHRASRALAIAGVLLVLPALPRAVSAQQQSSQQPQPPQGRVRARALGVAPGIFRPGALNAITDVAGVRVGHATVIAGDSVHTGVTAILPHGGDLFHDRVPAAIHVGNAFGKLVGATQVRELGELETPILLTCTLCVWRAADALVAELLAAPGMERVGSINPVVGETNDGALNAIRSRPITPTTVHEALASARGGPVAEGSVGAGAGTIAFEWKGGIGTSSRVVPKSLGGWTVGVLVQTNFGGVLQVLGAPVGRELGRWAFKDDVERERGDGSVMIVVATDAPLSDRNLERLAARAIMGLARTGSSASNGSGDYVIAFSTAEQVRRRLGPPATTPAAAPPPLRTTAELPNDETSALFEAVVEATEEAIYDSLFMATSVTSRGRTVDAIPLDRVRAVLDKYNVGRR